MTDTSITKNNNPQRNNFGRPDAQGLYDPTNEHDACGVGFLANIKGKRSHNIVERGIDILCNLTHRGAVGADPLDGDGAGVMIQIPDKFYREVVDFELPMSGDYAAGIVFLPQDEMMRKACEAAIESAVAENDMKVLGWREVETDNNNIGRMAKDVEPISRMVFVGRQGVKRRSFNLMLLVARKQAENTVRNQELCGDECFYINSLHSKVVLYKGMLLSEQLNTYFPELADERVESAFAFVHQRYSTNTFPTWDLAQPFRCLAHNGEINTIRGNVMRMKARQALFEHPELGERIKHLVPAVIEGASDTACMDNALEILTLCSRDLHHSLAMMVPEAWATKAHLPRKFKGFFEYHATMMEPWDGPANLVACNGDQIVAALDRNGLRPARYWITDDDEIIYASEAGVLNIPPEKIIRKDRLAPGKMIMVDFNSEEFRDNTSIKHELADAHPYAEWCAENLIHLEDLPAPIGRKVRDHVHLRRLQQAHGYTYEENRLILAPMAINGQEPVGSMGADTPLAVLSNKSKLLYWYFKQVFAQVTNPPIDPLREDVVMSLTQYVGPARNILQPLPVHCKMVELEQPILTNSELEQLRHADLSEFRGTTISTLYSNSSDEESLGKFIEELRAEAIKKVDEGYTMLVLSDRGLTKDKLAAPMLLVVSAIHHHLVNEGKRSQCSIIVETAEAREVHHFACLFGFGATAINPYLAFETVTDMFNDGTLPALDGNAQADSADDAIRKYSKNYIKAIGKGLMKIFSKIGISTLQSYCGAQVFNIVGINQNCVDAYFTGTATSIGGIGTREMHKELSARHHAAFAEVIDSNRDLERGGEYHWRRSDEVHLADPESIAVLQHSVFSDNYKLFKKYAKHVDEQNGRLCTLRGLFNIKGREPISLDEVEPAENIMRRFCTGAMSLGSISPEAHETLAIAMNQIGGKSNTGEGGEDPARFEDNRRSKIKQIASGRFGVTPHYLVNADELQIKVAQGAKPGEGGQLPGHKVSEYIGSLRYSVPGVTLISPPPHHDIYSIEDLAQLIYDLKNVNPEADIAVKLVAAAGVGTVAAGVSKGHAETVIISGFDGGTGASPISSIKHAGLPWEIGLAETQQTLVLNDLRGRIRVQTDGQMRTGRDVLVAALLGAEEYGFATVALMVTGCIMMRKCHLNTCPVGIATQDEELRKKYKGKPEHVVNYFKFVAEDLREQMAELGFHSLDEIIGHSEYLDMNKAIAHWKSEGLDFSKLLARVDMPEDIAIRQVIGQDHGLDNVLDRTLIEKAKPALEKGEKVVIDSIIKNSNRSACTMLSGEIARRYGREGLPADTVTVNFTGIAGQSFGTFVSAGMAVNLRGEGNDYVGKGMAGGRIVIAPDEKAPFTWEENSIVGNTVLYGATGGEAYFAGRAGERFCVRNSGVKAVIEGIGDHGAEYMTGGLLVCLGTTGRNFAAGMSGGIAYVLDEEQFFNHRCNHGMVALEQIDHDDDIAELRQMIENHVRYTGSPKGKRILENFEELLPKFVKVFPHEFRRVLLEREQKAKEVAAQA